MEEPCALIMIYLLLEKKRRRRWSVHPINQSRYVDGAFRNLYELIRDDSEKFFNYFRMSMTSFDELVRNIQENVYLRPSLLQGLGFSIEEMLVVTLRYLATGCSFVELHYAFRCGKTTIGVIAMKMCRVIWVTLAKDVFPKFTEELWLQKAEELKKLPHFPHALGAIDGKHVRIVQPQRSGSMLNNYKNYFSIVLMAVVDSHYNFLYVDVGAMGKESDSTVFDMSSFGRLLSENKLNIPQPEKITDNTNPLPYVFVADEAFGITPNIMRPFPGRHLTKSERIFNYRLCRARRFVECTFGILTNKWRIFHRALNIKFTNNIAVIKAACALHNYVRSRDGVQFEDTLDIVGLHEVEPSATQIELVRGKKAAYNYRKQFADYFSSPEGSVPWQDSKI